MIFLPRYRIVILAEDLTEAYNFVLLDRAAKRLLGKMATKLIAENSEVLFHHLINHLSI